MERNATHTEIANHFSEMEIIAALLPLVVSASFLTLYAYSVSGWATTIGSFMLLMHLAFYCISLYYIWPDENNGEERIFRMFSPKRECTKDKTIVNGWCSDGPTMATTHHLSHIQTQNDKFIPTIHSLESDGAYTDEPKYKIRRSLKHTRTSRTEKKMCFTPNIEIMFVAVFGFLHSSLCIRTTDAYAESSFTNWTIK